MKDDFQKPDYVDQLSLLLESSSPFNPDGKIQEKKYELLEKAIQFQAANNPMRKTIWENEGIDPSELEFPKDLKYIPTVKASDFKRYSDLREVVLSEVPDEAPEGYEDYEVVETEEIKEDGEEKVRVLAGKKSEWPERLTTVPESEIAVELHSSATGGNPSIEYNTEEEKELIRRAYLNAEKAITNGDIVDNMLIFGPSPEATPNTQSRLGRDALTDLSREHLYLLDESRGDMDKMKTIVKENFDRAEEKGESVALGFSVQLIHYILKDLYGNGSSWNFGDESYLIHGGGGWSGSKGSLEMPPIDKEEHIELVENATGIPRENHTDLLGISEPRPFACFSPWSDEYKDYVHHVPTAYCDVLVRDEETLEPLEEGEQGLLNVITPVAYAQATTSLLMDDIVELLEENENTTKIRYVKSAEEEPRKGGCGNVDWSAIES